MLDTPIPARMLVMEGTSIDAAGIIRVRENRANNLECGLPPVPKDRTLKTEPIAIVGYGPTLNQTWPQLKDYKQIWTTSRAHDFILERGVVPQVHVDLDPRIHKVEFMGNPQKGVRYFLSSHVHPAYPEKMKAGGFDAYMYHIAIDPKERLDGRWPSFKVRFDVGVQAAEIAYQFGYREQHWFGIEYGRAGAETHAAAHWGVKSEQCIVDVDGRLFGSTAMFIHGLLLAEHFLCDRALVRCTIHGDGLLGHFMKARGRVRFTLSP